MFAVVYFIPNGSKLGVLGCYEAQDFNEILNSRGVTLDNGQSAGMAYALENRLYQLGLYSHLCAS